MNTNTTDNKNQIINYNMTEQTTIGWTPQGRDVVFKTNIKKKSQIQLSEGASKEMMLETGAEVEIVALGIDCKSTKLGDKVRLRWSASPQELKIGENIYYQMSEGDILGYLK